MGTLAVVAFALAAQLASGQEKAQEKAKEAGPAEKGAKPAAQLVSEGEFSKWLVQVLGLSRLVSVAPSEQECFAVLLQNGISPKAGWNGTNVVTRATLARVVVQSLSRQSEVQDPDNDASWIEFLKQQGIDISTIGAAVENLDVMSAPLANEAVTVSTDPLGKVHAIRPEDEQQLGADLSTIRRVLLVVEERAPTPTPPPAPPRQRPPEERPPATPVFPVPI
jgi:hypothetical protein